MKVERWSWVLLIGMLVAGRAGATEQEPDVLIIDGDRVALMSNPLTPWVEENPNRLPEPDIRSTGNWRGYVATWEVKGSDLLLRAIGIHARRPGEDVAWSPASVELRDVMDEVFPGEVAVVATWYSGALLVPRGQLARYVHMGYASVYDAYTILRISEGRVISRMDLEGEALNRYRDERFEAYQQTERFRRAFEAEARGERWSAEELVSYLYQAHFPGYLISDEF